MKRNWIAFILVFVLTLSTLAWSGPHTSARAAILVTTFEDEMEVPANWDGDCSLREAILAAETDTAVDACAAGSGADIITLPAGTYPLSITGVLEDNSVSGDLDIHSSITFNGVSATTTIIDGGQIDRVFEIFPGANVTLSNLTVRNGKVMDQTDNDGGGIYNRGTLVLDRMTLSGNSAQKSGASGQPRGGGIYNTGELTATNSNILDNKASHTIDFTNAGKGGGIYNAAGASAAFTDCTISGNGAANFVPQQQNGFGGGIYNDNATLTLNRVSLDTNTAGGASPGSSLGGGLYNFNGTAAITNTTISGNQAPGGISFGGGVVNDGASADMTLTNVTLYANTAGNYGYNTYTFFGAMPIKVLNTIIASPETGFLDNCAGGIENNPATRITNLGNSMEYPEKTSPACGLEIADPKLAPLALNVPGQTRTHALLAGSAALDVPGACTGAPTVDQRGVVRPQGSSCDLGAYEKSASASGYSLYLPLVER